ncbi:MAG: GtrA family protein [Bacteroides sp.]|nr:GtrA family protein [Bacteroidales bacterium]MBD5316776.1 GtrA family protein [Bacteroides sp.]MBD5378248.1 GtrA family protein [Bacteroides sp.]
MIKIDLRSAAVRQFLRYLVVGVTNTLVTLIVIFVCKSLLGMNPWVSNACGYVAGLINSFILNKTWVFKSTRRDVAEAAKFAVGFLICYGIQLGVTWFLTTPMELGEIIWELGPVSFSGYSLATLVGMGVYTICNFVFNRLVTFK